MSSENLETVLPEETPVVEQTKDQLKKKRMEELKKIQERFNKGIWVKQHYINI